MIALGLMQDPALPITDPAADANAPPIAVPERPIASGASASSPSNTALFDPLAAAQAPVEPPSATMPAVASATPSLAPTVATPSATPQATTTQPTAAPAPSTPNPSLAMTEPLSEPVTVPVTRPRPVPSRVFVPAEHDNVVLPPEPEIGIAYGDLPRYVGRNLRVTLSNGTVRVATLERVDAQGLTLRVRMGGGWATFEVAREEIKLIKQR